MRVPRHTLAKAIAERTIDVKDEKLLAREIAAYLLEEKRTAELESILRDIMQYRTDNGALEAVAVSAHTLEPKVIEEIAQLLQSTYATSKPVKVSQRLDEAVIGGVRIDMANEQLDMTVGAKLSKFKKLTSEATT